MGCRGCEEQSTLLNFTPAPQSGPWRKLVVLGSCPLLTVLHVKSLFAL